MTAKDYDIILHSVKEIKRATIDLGSKNRAERIQKAAYKANTIKGKKQADFVPIPTHLKTRTCIPEL